MNGYRITARARADLRDISDYTRHIYGNKKRIEYITSLVSRMEWLSGNPHIGKRLPELRSDYRCYPEGEHLIFYIVKRDYLSIIAVLHNSSDFTRHLRTNH